RRVPCPSGGRAEPARASPPAFSDSSQRIAATSTPGDRSRARRPPNHLLLALAPGNQLPSLGINPVPGRDVGRCQPRELVAHVQLGDVVAAIRPDANVTVG